MPLSRRRRLLNVSLAVAAVAIFGWLLLPITVTTGVEFSPDRFAHRSFRYYDFFGIQVTPKQTHEWRSDVDAYVHKNGFVSGIGDRTPRWHLVKGFAPSVRGWHGKAKYMCQSVGCWAGSDRWVQWSNAHPKLAKLVWPQVVAWARSEEYHKIMSLFRFSDLDAATTPGEVKQKIAIANRQS